MLEAGIQAGYNGTMGNEGPMQPRVRDTGRGRGARPLLIIIAAAVLPLLPGCSRLLRPPRHPPHPFGPRPMPRPRRTAERPWVRCVNPISGFSMPSAIPPTRRRLRRRRIRLPRPVEEALRPRPDLLPLRQLRLLTLSLSAQSLRATTRPRPRLISLPNKPPDQPRPRRLPVLRRPRPLRPHQQIPLRRPPIGRMPSSHS